jgi:hypothetical protein
LSYQYRQRVAGCLFLVCSFIFNTPRADAAIKVIVNIRQVSFDNTTVTIVSTVKPVNADIRGHGFTFTAANVADVTLIVDAMKIQIISYIFNTYSVVIVANEIAIFGAPQ